MEFIKLIENQQELDAYKATVNSNVVDPNLLRVGDMMYRDLNGDGTISRDDVKLLGDNTPHYIFGANLGARYKGFDLSLIIQGVGKQAIRRNANAATILVQNTYQMQGNSWYGKNWSDLGERYPSYQVTFQGKDGNTVTEALLTAPVNKDPNAVPKTTTDGALRGYDYLYSDAWFRLQNGAYARMKNITLGYSLPPERLSKTGIERLRIYFSGNDLFEFTRTKDGWDPESTYENPFGGDNRSYAYPFMRSFSLGIDLTF